MTSWTSDILLMSDLFGKKGSIEDWEAELEREKAPKLKFPISATSENLDEFETEFTDPEVPEVKERVEKRVNETPKIVELGKKGRKNKNDKPKLF